VLFSMFMGAVIAAPIFFVLGGIFVSEDRR
jgi:hypothetical protein